MLVHIDLQKEELLYIDPLGPPDENKVAQEMAYKWLEWALLYNTTCPHTVIPVNIRPVTVQHVLQQDGRNCRIFAMCVCIQTCLMYHILHRRIYVKVAVF